MKAGWEVRKLGEVCEVIGGGTPSKRKSDYYDGDIPWATVRDMKSNSLSQTEHSISEEGLQNSSSKVIPAGNVVIATRVGLGKVCLLKMDTAINQDLKGLIPKYRALLDVKYLFNWYKSISDTVVKNGTGMTVKGVKVSFIKNLPIPIPPLPEQRAIVAKLDAAFAGIAQARANIERNIQNAEELFQSKLNAVFAGRGEGSAGEVVRWEEKTLGELCGFYNGKAHEKDIDKNGKFIVVNSKFISSDGKVKKYTPEQKFPLLKNDIVMVMSDVPNGKALAKCHIIETPDLYSLNQRICAIRSEKFNTRFLYYHLNRHPFLLSFNNGENQTNLRKGDILNCPLLLPKMEDQVKLADMLDSFSNEKKRMTKIYQKKLDALNEIQQSLLQRAFSGQLTENEVAV